MPVVKERCVCCGRVLFFGVETIKVDGIDEYWCLQCQRARVRTCQDCRQSFDRVNSSDHADHVNSCGSCLCDNCAENYHACRLCGINTHEGDLDGSGCCRDCQEENGEEEDSIIHPYHEGSPRDTLYFHPEGTNRKRLYLGVELETDNYPSTMWTAKAAKALVDISDEESLFWLEEDGSLNNGFEIVSHPCTLAYHKDKFPWGKMLQIVLDNNGHGAKTKTAALHVHFNRRFFSGKHSELYQLRLIYLFEKFRDELARLGRTSEYLLRRSAKKYNRTLYNMPAKNKIKELEENYDRLYAVNLTNRDTIEIRIFRSTLKYSTLIASLELVNFLIRTAKNCSTKQLQKTTWEELLKLVSKKRYRYLPRYVTYCQAHPRTEIKEAIDDESPVMLFSESIGRSAHVSDNS